MDLQEEAGLESKLKEKQHFRKQLKSLSSSSFRDCSSSLHLPNEGERLFPMHVLFCSLQKGTIQLCTY